VVQSRRGSASHSMPKRPQGPTPLLSSAPRPHLLVAAMPNEARSVPQSSLSDPIRASIQAWSRDRTETDEPILFGRLAAAPEVQSVPRVGSGTSCSRPRESQDVDVRLRSSRSATMGATGSTGGNMARADLLLELVSSGAGGDDLAFRRAAEALIAERQEERRPGLPALRRG
jgi:hypothetical protein